MSQKKKWRPKPAKKPRPMPSTLTGFCPVTFVDQRGRIIKEFKP